MKKILSWIGKILYFCFFLICIFSLFVSISTKKNADEAVNLFGYQLRIITSSSMERCDETDVSEYAIKDLPVKTLIFVRTVPKDDKEAEKWYSELRVGDVLTFRYVYGRQITITHRITEITRKDSGGYVIRLAGDNKNSEDGVLEQTIDTSLGDSPNYVIGKVSGKSFLLGLLIHAVKSPIGIILIIIVPCLIILILELIQIYDILTQKKKQKRLQEVQEKNAEIEVLKQKLAEVQAVGASQKGAEKDNDTSQGDVESS